jgi:hypothetical protein
MPPSACPSCFAASTVAGFRIPLAAGDVETAPENALIQIPRFAQGRFEEQGADIDLAVVAELTDMIRR